MLDTMIGKPVINGHIDVGPEDFRKHAVGYVTRVWFNEKDGWYWAEYLAIDEEAKRNSSLGKKSVSCGFTVTETRGGGEYHAMRYDEEIINGEFTHLALVDAPRYEDCQIFVNSKEGIINGGRKMAKKLYLINALELDKMSVMQRDQYLQSLSDAGLDEMANGEYPAEIKEQVKRHQDLRTREKEEEMLAAQAGQKPGGGGAGKKNEIDAKTATVEVKAKNGKTETITIHELIERHNATVTVSTDDPAGKKPDGEEKPAETDEEKAKREKAEADAKKENATKLHDVAIKAVADWKATPSPELKSLASTAVANAKTAAADVAALEAELAKPEIKTNEKPDGKPAERSIEHFVKLNNLAEAGAEATGHMVETTKSKLERGMSRYGSKKK